MASVVIKGLPLGTANVARPSEDGPVAMVFPFRTRFLFGPEPEVERKFGRLCLARPFRRAELTTAIIRDCLVSDGYLQLHDLDEETEPGGVA